MLRRHPLLQLREHQFVRSIDPSSNTDSQVSSNYISMSTVETAIPSILHYAKRPRREPGVGVRWGGRLWPLRFALGWASTSYHRDTCVLRKAGAKYSYQSEPGLV